MSSKFCIIADIADIADGLEKELLQYDERKSRNQVREICARNGWRVSVVHQLERADEKPGKEYRR